MTVGLSREPGAPLHHQLSAVLRSAIVAGKYDSDGYLPGENALMTSFGVSRATVRRALLTLEAEQLIDRRQGKGTRVRWNDSPAPLSPIDEHLRRIERQAERTSISLLDFDVVQAPIAVRRALGLPERAQALRIIRVRADEHGPLRHMTSYLDNRLGARLDRLELEGVTLIEALRRIGHGVRRTDDEVGATLADPATATALDVGIGAPLLELARTMFNAEDEPVAFQ